MSEEGGSPLDQDWKKSPDAMVWANKLAEYIFIHKINPRDPGDMVVWFANAMAAAEGHAAKLARDNSTAVGTVPLVTYADGIRHDIGEIEIRDTPDGFVVVAVEVLDSDVASPTSAVQGKISPSLRANPYEPAIYGMGLSGEGLRMVDEIDRNARAYGYEIGRGHPLAKFIPVASDGNPFLKFDWRDGLQKEVDGNPQKDDDDEWCSIYGYQIPEAHVCSVGACYNPYRDGQILRGTIDERIAGIAKSKADMDRLASKMGLGICDEAVCESKGSHDHGFLCGRSCPVCST